MINNKICSAHQPAFLPWAGYIHKVMLCDDFVFMDISKFRKRAFMHRNMIEINSMEHFLGLRVSKDSDLLSCDEVYLNKNNLNCLDEIVKKIEHSYKKAKYKKDLDEFISFSFNSLREYGLNSICKVQLNFFLEKFNITANLIEESKLINKSELKFFNASERLLKHAIMTKSGIYITGINSSNYLDFDLFKKNNILNYIQKFNYQVFKDFQSSDKPLSLIHQISVLGFEKIKNILETKQVSKNNIIYD